MPEKTWKQIMDEAEKEAPSFKPLPENEYDFVISKSEATQTKTGKDMFKVQAKVVTGDFTRRVVFHNFVLSYESPQSMGIFFRQMKVLGFDDNFFDTNPSLEAVAAEMVGKVFRGRVVIEDGWNATTQKRDDKENQGNAIKNFATAGAEARQAALNVPTANNPNPVASPSSSTPAAPTATAPVAPPVTPSATPSSPPIPPPPPAPSF